MRVINIINLLSAHLSQPVILGNQAAPKPPYPYIAINETVQRSTSNGYIENRPLPDDINQVKISQPTFTLSVTAYSDHFDDAVSLSEQAHGWFGFAGKSDLKHDGFVVVSVGNIIPRDSLIIDDYERRRGFDVSIRFTDVKERFIEEIKHVKGTLNSHPFEANKE